MDFYFRHYDVNVVMSAHPTARMELDCGATLYLVRIAGHVLPSIRIALHGCYSLIRFEF